MTGSAMFASGLAITLGSSLVVVFYLQRSLHRLLIELCGNPNRAQFWTAFSAVTVGLVPLIFALGYRPDEQMPAVLEIAGQLKWAFIGMALSVLCLGWTVSRFIPRAPRNGVPPFVAR